MENRGRNRQFLARLVDGLVPVVAVLFAFLVGAIILWLQGVSPVEAYRQMIVGAFGTKNGLADTLVKAIPLMLVGLGIAIAFRGGVINIGAEGQMIVGALLTTFVGVQLAEGISPVVGISVAILAGALMGAIWGAIPGYLKARLGVNEILSTIMMNQIAIQIGYYLLRGPMIDPAEVAAGTNIPQSARLGRAFDVPRFTDRLLLGLDRSAADLGLDGFLGEIYAVLVEPSRLHSGLIFAIIMAVLVYILLWRTTLGYRIRAVGLSRSASEYAGIPVRRTIVLSMTFSGLFAGLAGAVEIRPAPPHVWPAAVLAGYGFTGIVAALGCIRWASSRRPCSSSCWSAATRCSGRCRFPGVDHAILGLVVLFVVSTDTCPAALPGD